MKEENKNPGSGIGVATGLFASGTIAEIAKEAVNIRQEKYKDKFNLLGKKATIENVILDIHNNNYYEMKGNENILKTNKMYIVT